MKTELRITPIAEPLPWMTKPEHKDLMVQLNIASIAEEEDEEDDDGEDDCDKVYACRTIWQETNKEVLAIMICRNGTPAFNLEVAYEMPNKLLLGRDNIQTELILFFMDDEDENLLTNTAFMMAFSIEDLNAIPFFPPQEDTSTPNT